MVTKELIKTGEHNYNLVIRHNGKVIYDNYCIGVVMKRRKDADIKFKKIKRLYCD